MARITVLLSKTTVHVPANKPPVANAGTDQTVINGALVYLSGAASSDPDNGPSSLTYAWTQASGTAVSLTGATSSAPHFTAPQTGDYVFSLVVKDGLDSSPASKVTVHFIANKPPVANAGADQTVTNVSQVTLDGSASSDPDKGPAALTYAWTQISGVSVKLNSATVIKPSFTPSQSGDYVFSLVVKDGKDISPASKVTVHFIANKPPVANAGADQTVKTLQAVTLNGSASSDPDNGPSALTYAWTVVSGPSSVSLSNATSAKPTFTPSASGDYVFGLTVKDGKDTSPQAKVTIHVTNQAPVANAGLYQTVKTLQAVTLDGSASSDPDKGPNALTYAWTLVSGPAAATLSSPLIAKPSFTPSASGDYVFGLTVKDGKDTSPQAKVTIHVTNQAPVANAGLDQTVKTLQAVTLDGSASSDPDKGPTALTYAWTVVSGPAAVSLSNPTLAKPGFTPSASGDYVFGLVVKDGKDTSPQAKVTIHATNQAPVANAGIDQTVKTLQAVTLDGSASSDPDKGPTALTYAWTVVSGPAAVSLSNATSAKPTFTPSASGDYVFGLVVKDGKDTSPQAKVTIHVVK